MLAMAAEPLVQLFERRGHSRSRAVGISFGLAVLAVVGFAYLLVTPFVHESRHLVDDADFAGLDPAADAATFGCVMSRKTAQER